MAGNRIDVNLKLLQNKELKLLQQATEQFREAARSIEISLKSYSGQVAGYAGVAEQGGFSAGGVRNSGTNPQQKRPIDPSKTGHGGSGVDQTHSDFLEGRRAALRAEGKKGGLWNKAIGYGASAGFAPGFIEQDLEARIRAGNVGEMRTRDFFQYASYLAGKRGLNPDAIDDEGNIKIDPNTGKPMSVVTNRFMAGASGAAGTIAMGIPMAQSAHAFAQRVGRGFGMGFDQNAPYVQLGMNARGPLGGMTIGSQAWREGYTQKLGTSFQSFMNTDWGKAQERQMRESLLGIGVNASHGGRGSMIAQNIRDISRDTGLESPQLVQMMQHTIRFGTNAELDTLTSTLKNLKEAAKSANMTTKQFADGIVELSTSISGRTGMSSAQSTLVASQMQQQTGLQGGMIAGMATSDATVLSAMAQNHVHADQLTGGMLSSQALSQIMMVVGSSSLSDLKANWEKVYKHKYSDMFTFLHGTLMGAPMLNEQDAGKLINTSGGNDKAMNDLASAAKGKHFSNKQLDSMAKGLLSKSDYSNWHDNVGSPGGFLGLNPHHASERDQVNAIQKALKKEHGNATTQIGLTSDAQKLVKLLGMDDTAHRNKRDNSRSATWYDPTTW